ncbi:MAG: sugar phosphate nucleotidyltransferase [Chlamydiales bacterium]|nr:sugar phosphate nucleotidyltransferase [Chlamydiales bacterium]
MLFDANRVVSIVLGGGEGKRLFPLTKFRCKPSIPFGQFRLIDIPVSHSLHANFRRIFVITQFLSYSLHRHLLHTYRLDSFSSGFIEVLAPEQKPGKGTWYAGTADAVRQNLEYLVDIPADYFLILSGDQLYNMDFNEIVSFACKKDADLTIASIPVSRKDASRMGILNINENADVTNFIEKPASFQELAPFATNEALFKKQGIENIGKRVYIGSMGIYVFKRKALFDLLRSETGEDFGHHLIPAQIRKGKVAAYLYDGYWEDIGTIESFYNASISLVKKKSLFDCYDEKRSIFTAHHHLPGPKIIKCKMDGAIVCNGAIVEAKEIANSIIGPRSIIGKNCSIRNSIVFGNDFYESSACDYQRLPQKLVIDDGCLINKAIIDKNVYLGKNVQLINKNNLVHYDGDNIFVRDGIMIVPEGAHIPDGFVF